MNLFEREWETWAAIALHADIKPQSRDALQVAFYSGAMTWAKLVRSIVIEHDHVDAVVLLTDLHSEMGAYTAKLREAAGRNGADAQVQ